MSPQVLLFEVARPDGSSESYSVPYQQPIWLGRAEDCDILLSGRNVSRRHVSVSLVGHGFTIDDCSANGTLLNGLRFRGTSRSVRDSELEIGVGSFRVRVRAEALPGQRPGAANQVQAALRRRIHRALLDHLDLAKLELGALSEAAMRPKVSAALRRILAELGAELPAELERERLVRELTDEALGLGPLEELLRDPAVSEIMVVDPYTIFAERQGRIQETGLTFTDADAVRAVIERIVTPLGRRIDESTPLVDARLKDGSRVNAVIPPLAIKGPCITIRKFSKAPLGIAEMVRCGSLTPAMAKLLERSVQVRRNILIAGGTGSGKTTLLNALSLAIPEHERVVTVEDAAELRLAQAHVVALEARPPNLEGRGEYSIRDLVKNALRMRPDRILVGECRGGEAIDMLQAMNTGHEGSMTTTHANSPREAVARLEMLCLMSGLDLPIRAVRQQISSSVHLIVQQARLSDGSRRVTSVAEVCGIDDGGEIEIAEIFKFVRTGTEANGQVLGQHIATGRIPSFVDLFISHGLAKAGVFL